MSEQEPRDWVRSRIGHSTADHITVAGRDVADELMGRVSFTDLAFMLVARRAPTAGEARVFDAVLVSLTDHGLTPTVLAARLTYTGAPESLQGAVAAGLLGAGSVFLGPTADTARFLHEIVAAEKPDGEAALRAAGEAAVRALLDQGRRVPGLGHPIHKDVDPRVPRLYELAAESGVLGPHMRLLEARARGERGGLGAAAADQRRRRRRRGARRHGAAGRGGARASRCWPAPLGWSAISPRRPSSRSECRCTGRSTGG